MSNLLPVLLGQVLIYIVYLAGSGDHFLNYPIYEDEKFFYDFGVPSSFVH